MLVDLEEQATPPAAPVPESTMDILLRLTSSLNKVERRFERMSDGIEHNLTRALEDNRAYVNQSIERLSLQIRENGEQDKVSHQTNSQGLKDIASALNTIRDYTAEKNKELRRYKDGYDFSLLRNFSKRMIQAVDELEERISDYAKGDSDTKLASELEFACETVVMALDSQGIERFEPEVGQPLDTESGTMEAVGKSPTESVDLHGKIAQVIRPGYQIYQEGGEHKLIRPAQVQVYYKGT